MPDPKFTDEQIRVMELLFELAETMKESSVTSLAEIIRMAVQDGLPMLMIQLSICKQAVIIVGNERGLNL